MFPAGSLAARLDGYAAALTYGRDLLHTHLATTPHGGRRALSDWAPVISSAPVNRALLAGLADHARAIAGQLARLPLAGPPTLRPSRHGSVSRAQPGSCGNSTRPSRRPSGRRRCFPSIASCWRLSRSTSRPPCRRRRRRRPVSDLCAGIISTAQRANQARRELAARAAWSPELTADSMRHAAANYVVISFNTETVYRVLAARARQLGYHALVPGLDAAADHADDSRRAWLAVAHVWDTMVTDTRGYLSRPAAEAGHLALWTGRLAYADPAWTPARRPSHAVRDPASLAPGPAALTEVASAMHYAADSLARAARTELDTRPHSRLRRAPVRHHPQPARTQYDVPRPYADAPRDRIADALAAYADAADTSQAALRSAADVAAAVDAPSRVLSAADAGDGRPGGRAARPS